MKWNFKTVSNGEIVELNDDQKPKVGTYETVLEDACSSKVANPKFSNFFVKGNLGTALASVMAGNIEYGLCKALHCEESAVAAWRSRLPLGEPILGIISHVEGKPASPCGNCRDILRDEFAELEIVAGTEGGGEAVVVPMKEYLFENYHSAGSLPRNFKRYLKRIADKGEKSSFDPYSPLNNERKYLAFIAGAKRNYYGSLSLRCDYHPIYPLEDAIRRAERNCDAKVGFVMVACEGKMPDVMYRDRQHLLELNLDYELLEGKPADPRVYLVNYSSEERDLIINEVKETFVKEWLPMPFSPRNFGKDFIDNVLKPHVLKKYQ
ncbi:MAG: hypothetical protein ABIB71_03615 [Candidatus Woesearchaeota archaeon]